MRFLTGLMLTAVAAAPVAAAPKSVEVRPYGSTKAGQPVSEYILRNPDGAEVHVISYGGIITQIDVPDRRGHNANVALGFGSLADYEAHNQDYRFGAIIGRYAGRIAGARFTVGGKEVKLVANDGPNALHGGAFRVSTARCGPSSRCAAARPEWCCATPAPTASRASLVR